MKNSILNLTSEQQMELYKKETGATKIEMFTFQEFIFMKMLDEI